VHDAWSPYDGYANADHQLCCAHVLRELRAVADAAAADEWCWALGAIVISGHPEATSKPQVVVLAVEQPAGQRKVLSHQLAAAGGGLADPDQRGGTIAGDLLD